MWQAFVNLMSNPGAMTLLLGLIQVMTSAYVAIKVKAYFDEKLADRNSILNERLEHVRSALNNSKELFLKRLNAHEKLARLQARANTDNDATLKEKFKRESDVERALLLGKFNRDLYTSITKYIDDFGVYLPPETHIELIRGSNLSHSADPGHQSPPCTPAFRLWSVNWENQLIMNALSLAEMYMRRFVRGFAGEELNEQEQRALEYLQNPAYPEPPG